jgi:hypothetical protein
MQEAQHDGQPHFGQRPWDLRVQGVRAANSVIIPLGCPKCLTQPGQLENSQMGSTTR